ncbi:hypothetical protein G4G28_20610 [Massilia sp. Dwa41.01b]|uniref:hypothetical protein n=1 Tax=unclassified Massilia TaxID=2609279 RepID=UPI001601CA02|nr:MULTISPECIES: hypothetical protein [unclassified Massilia]QNA90305.1 hypothetical protein G4G28_20610 [Massilia sp. Dwa41.01b]QNB01205.1 hypothetical protein G4G31_24235 [Massilia sp. Se16.2.3]
MRQGFAIDWQGLWNRLGKPAPPALLAALLAAYSEPQRHYHTLQHLGECLSHFDAEYAHVPAALFASKRRDVLQRFLARSAIYHTAHFAATLEARARANLGAALARG